MHNACATLSLPPVSVVVIGLNVESFLRQALTAIRSSDYPQGLLEVIYVDSGSTDRSREIAAEFSDIQLIDLNDPSPNAAKGRNAGFRAARHPLVQFVDADSYLEPGWLKRAVALLNNDVAAVAGELQERFPQRNFFHKMAHLEWNLRMGEQGWSTQVIEAKSFGGNVMVDRHVFTEVEGYNESMKAGEDPDLSYRIRQAGYRILRLNVPMASHDINLSTWSQFLSRARRSGRAYAWLAGKYWRNTERFMVSRVLRVLGSVLIPQVLMVSGVILDQIVAGMILGLLFAFRLLFKAKWFSRLFQISFSKAFLYALYLTLSVYPQFLGVLDVLSDTIRKQASASFNFLKDSIFSPTVRPVYKERQN